MPLPDHVALVLQGGGALGSFQAGVYEALAEQGVGIDWVAGISIGAINAAIIAGNPPEDRCAKLTQFWELASGNLPAFWLPDSDELRELAHLSAAAAVTAMGVPGFFKPHFIPPMFAPEGSQSALSFYDSGPLVETLDSLVDWKLLNDGPVRVSIGAVDIESGNFEYFDNRSASERTGRRTRIDARHIMASGALPPGLPPIQIGGRHYWDGGLVSNTPLSHVLDHQRGDLLVFQVDLFPARGPMPRTITDVWSRMKDVQYSSRTRQVTDNYLKLRREHKHIDALLKKLPPELWDDADAKALRDMLDDGAVNIVHLIYRNRAWESGARDFEFSANTMLDHWAQGQEAVADVMCKGDLIARNIVDGKSATFDLETPDYMKEKEA